jgi:hypothetical protein
MPKGSCLRDMRTPGSEEMLVSGEDLEVGHRYGAPVEMMQMKHGIFYEASISVIAYETVSEIVRLAGTSPDVRRFRPNVVGEGGDHGHDARRSLLDGVS